MANDKVKKVIQEAREYSEPIVTDALMKGVTRIRTEMDDVATDEDQSLKMFLRKMAITLRNGAVTSGKEMLSNGLKKDSSQ
ncbi:hypothetical protein [Gracilibacillus dipsosauri]|uniref:hypothetical protein n=1 Tax=Gracilibacillus dipsosauri TaxID=178340 RepID=UPI0006D2BF2D